MTRWINKLFVVAGSVMIVSAMVYLITWSRVAEMAFAISWAIGALILVGRSVTWR